MATVRCIAKRSVDTATCPLSLLILTIPNSCTAIASRLADEVAPFIYNAHYTIFHQTGNSNTDATIPPYGIRECIGIAIILLWCRGVTPIGGNTI